MQYYITNEIAVLKDTIVRTGVKTQDTDENGYYTQDGTNREVCYGQDGEGNWWLWAHTNGGDIVVCDDHDQLKGVCRDMTDNYSDDHLEHGMDRLMEAALMLPDGGEYATWLAGELDGLRKRIKDGK